MKNFTRREQTGSPTPTQRVPEDWPSGALDPDSDFFVPQELRAFYSVNSPRERGMFGTDSDQKDFATGLPSLDYAMVQHHLTNENLRRAGIDPRRSSTEQRTSFLKQQAARITQRDRALFLHRWRLNEARAAMANEQRLAVARAERREQLTCRVCGEFHNLTREVRFSRSDDPQAMGRPLIKTSVCPACMELVRQTINEQAAEQVTAAGKTRREAAADLVRAALRSEQS